MAKHPEVLVIDPFDRVRPVLNRGSVHDLIESARIVVPARSPAPAPKELVTKWGKKDKHKDKHKDKDKDKDKHSHSRAPLPPAAEGEKVITVHSPEAFVVEFPLRDAKPLAGDAKADAKDAPRELAVVDVHGKPQRLVFPVICKRLTACGTAASHSMVLVKHMYLFSFYCVCLIICADGCCSSGLDKLSPGPWFVQRFVNHDARLFKVYVVAKHSFIVVRKSLPNVEAGDTSTLVFESHKMDLVTGGSGQSNGSSTSSNGTAHADTEKPKEKEGKEEGKDKDKDKDSEPKSTPAPASFTAGMQRRVEEISRQLRRKLRLALFGYDMIVSSDTGEYFVVDINHFPSYEGVDRFPQRLVNFLVSKHVAHRRSLANSGSSSTVKA